MSLNQEDFKLIERLNQFESGESDFFAQNIYKIFGRFSPETFLIQLESWLDDQARNHEFFHLLQFLFLPVPYFYGQVRRQHLELEAIYLLKVLDQNLSLPLSKYAQMSDVLNNRRLILNQDFFDRYKRSLKIYSFYNDVWDFKLEGISLRYITESMAHIGSMQLSDQPEVDTLKLTGEEYDLAYQYFLKYLSCPNDIDIRFRYLLFIYICYFSLLVVEDYQDEKDIDSIGVKTFIHLCSQAQYFVEVIERHKAMFNSYSRTTLVEYDKWEIAEFLTEVSDQKISSVYAFFETVDFIEQRANLIRVPQKFSNTSKNKDWEDIINQNQLVSDNHFLMAKMVLFPSEFYKLHEMYENFMNIVSKDRHFTYEDESQFYFFIQQIKNLFRQGMPMHCCDEHGYIQDEYLFLSCDDEDSSANRIARMAKKDAYDVFQI